MDHEREEHVTVSQTTRRQRSDDARNRSALLEAAGKRDNLFLVFFGFAIGWVPATVARYVYPPPKKYRQRVNEAT